MGAYIISATVQNKKQKRGSRRNDATPVLSSSLKIFIYKSLKLQGYIAFTTAESVKLHSRGHTVAPFQHVLKFSGVFRSFTSDNWLSL